MSNAVGESYDAMVEPYAEVNLDALAHDAHARTWLATFADLAAPRTGPVADLGCGPGHVVDHLQGLGLTVVGYDISAGQITKARATFPDSKFHTGDLESLDVADSSFGGIVSRYSIIHVPPPSLGVVFAEWRRVAEPGAPVLVSFFAASSTDDHGLAFDHKVITAYALHPATIAHEMERAGFDTVDVDVQPRRPDSGRPFEHATALVRVPDDQTTSNDQR